MHERGWTLGGVVLAHERARPIFVTQEDCDERRGGRRGCKLGDHSRGHEPTEIASQLSKTNLRMKTKTAESSSNIKIKTKKQKNIRDQKITRFYFYFICMMKIFSTNGTAPHQRARRGNALLLLLLLLLLPPPSPVPRPPPRMPRFHVCFRLTPAENPCRRPGSPRGSSWAGPDPTAVFTVPGNLLY